MPVKLVVTDGMDYAEDNMHCRELYSMHVAKPITLKINGAALKLMPGLMQHRSSGSHSLLNVLFILPDKTLLDFDDPASRTHHSVG